MCVCVSEKERERKRDRERETRTERERGGEGERPVAWTLGTRLPCEDWQLTFGAFASILLDLACIICGT